MSKIPRDPPPAPAPDDPPCATTKMDKTRWFEEEVHVHDAKLKAYLRSSFPTIDVEAVVQESYLRTWLAHAAKPLKSAKAFLFTVARREAINLAQRQKKSPVTTVRDLLAFDVIDESRGAAETAAINDELALLADALDALPPQCRKIIVLRKIKNIPQRQVAASLRITEGAVEKQVYLGFLRLEAYFTSRGVIKPW